LIFTQKVFFAGVGCSGLLAWVRPMATTGFGAFLS
jgi:hypothetical protein